MAFVTTAVQCILLPLAGLLALVLHLCTSLLDLVFGRGKRLKSPKCLVITGATAGIGEALALHYAKPGVTLALTGRNEARLEVVARACTERGAIVKKGKLDVTDEAGMAKFLLKVDGETAVDCVIANAGISEETVKLERDIVGATRALFATNVDGVFNTILPLLPAMKARGAGRIVIMSSMASTGPMSGAVAYSATKAAVRTYGEALRGLLYRDGIRVNVVCPGYVESDMTAANKSHMPGLMAMPQALRIITAGIARDTPVILFPAWISTAFWLFSRVFPPDLLHALGRRRLGAPFLKYLRTRRS